MTTRDKTQDWLQVFLCELIDEAQRHGDTPLFPLLARRAADAVNRSLDHRPPPLAPDVAADLATLERESYLPLGALLTPAQLADIHDFLRPLTARAPFQPGQPEYATDHAPDEVNFLDYHRDDVVRCPHVLDVLNHPMVLDRVAAFLGGVPTLQAAIIRRSYAGPAEPQQNQLYHSDPWHCFAFLKLFIYLTDVDEADGPHVYVRASHDNAELRARVAGHVAAHPDDAGRFDILFGSERKPDPVVETFFPKDDIIRVKGAAGSAFLGNTRALHKGELPKERDRVALIGLYGLLPGLRPALRFPGPATVPDYAARHAALYGDFPYSRHLAHINRLLAQWE